MGGRRDSRDNNAALVFLVVMVVSAVIYFLSFLLTRSCRATASCPRTAPARC